MSATTSAAGQIDRLSALSKSHGLRHARSNHMQSICDPDRWAARADAPTPTPASAGEQRSEGLTTDRSSGERTACRRGRHSSETAAAKPVATKDIGHRTPISKLNTVPVITPIATGRSSPAPPALDCPTQRVAGPLPPPLDERHHQRQGNAEAHQRDVNGERQRLNLPRLEQVILRDPAQRQRAAV